MENVTRYIDVSTVFKVILVKTDNMDVKTYVLMDHCSEKETRTVEILIQCMYLYVPDETLFLLDIYINIYALFEAFVPFKTTNNQFSLTFPYNYIF